MPNQSKRKAKAVLRWLWRWSLLVTVPVTCLFILWLVQTGDKYLAMGIRYHTLDDEVNLQRLALYEGQLIKRDLALALTPKEIAAKRRLPHIQMYVPDGSESALNSDLPHSGKSYVEASLVYPNGDLWGVKMRYRGDHFWHWAGRKKSLRIKTKKSQLYDRMRTFNLSAPKMPDQISGYLSYFLAAQLDLITPKCELVDVYINGGYRGMYILLEQLEEMVIRKHGKMPGDVYAADIVGDDRYRGLSSLAFANAGLWEKIAINNHFPEAEREALNRLVECLMAPSSPERSADLRGLVDLEAFGHFAAFRTLCQSEHYDNTHNWRLYYDPWKNRFQPIVWDPVGWALAWRPKSDRRARADIVSSLLDKALMEDHQFLAEREQAIEDYYADGRDEDLLAELDRVAAMAAPSIATDPSLTYKIKALTPDQVQEALVRFRWAVKTTLDHCREDYLAVPRLEYATSPALGGRVRLSLTGRRGIDGVTFRLTEPINSALTAEAFFLTGAGVQRIDVTGAMMQQGANIRIELPFRGQLEPDPDYTGQAWLSPGYRAMPGSFEIILQGADFEGNDVLEVTGQYGDGQMVRGTAVRTILPQPFAYAKSVLEPVPRIQAQIWEGERIVSGVQYISSDVVIRPGTTLRMEPKASIIFEGRVLAQGTQAAPIRVIPATEGQDWWGVIALRGPGADGSELAHCHMKFGSGLKTATAEFSAMLSIHDVDGISVRSCLFEDSQVVDDMVHAVYSDVHFLNCGFVRSLFDALDLDITMGTVEGCRFHMSGNDGLDLMTSTILVKDCWIEGSGDKGASIGEDTQAFFINTKIKDCLIGAQIKDRSRATFYNCEVSGNGIGLDAYKKNWRYDAGGLGFVYKSLLLDNDETFGADKHSRFMVHDSGLRGPVKESKRIFIDPTSSTGAGRQARFRELKRFPGEEAISPSYFEAGWQEARPDLRGLKPKS